jgi:hypothetical protein
MGIINWFRSVFGNADMPRHDYVYPPILFPQLNVQTMQRRMRLSEQGAERGKLNLPSASDDSYDNVENNIVTVIQSEIQLVQEKLSEQLRAYNDRQASLSVATRINQLGTSADDTVSRFFTCVQQGRDTLFRMKHDFLEIDKEYRQFQLVNGLKRLPRYPLSKVFHWSIIVFFVVVETAANGVLLAVGNTSGLVGGIGEALIIATFNVLMGIFLGSVALRYWADRRINFRITAFVGFLVWILLAIIFNLGVAHYRTALAGDTPADAGRLALIQLKSDPFGIPTLGGWLLLGVGLIFNCGAAIDRWKMDDPYPGYGELARRRDELREDYVSEKQEIENRLEAIKMDSVQQLDELSTEIEFKVDEYRTIDQSRSSIGQLFTSQLTYLEQCCNELLAIYRQANIGNRTLPAPQHFHSPWVSTVKAHIPQPYRDADHFEQLQAALKEVGVIRRQILEAFKSSMQEFRAIEEMASEAKS